MNDQVFTSPGIVIIEDEVDGRLQTEILLQQGLGIWMGEQNKPDRRIVIIVAIDHPPTYFSSRFPSVNNEKRSLITIDCWTNPNGWNESKSTQPNVKIFTQLNNIESLIQDLTTEIRAATLKCESVVVLFDNLSTLLQWHSGTAVVSMINKLYRSFDDEKVQLSLVGLIHRDIHEEYTIKSIEYVADTVMSILPLSESGSVLHLSILQRRTTGKSTRTDEHYRWKDKQKLELIERVENDKNNENTATTSKKADPTANLTFNLTLTEEQRKAKDAVVLPYRHHMNAESTTATVGKGSVIYIDEDDDAFNDEDDDLDI